MVSSCVHAPHSSYNLIFSKPYFLLYIFLKQNLHFASLYSLHALSIAMTVINASFSLIITVFGSEHALAWRIIVDSGEFTILDTFRYVWWTFRYRVLLNTCNVLLYAVIETLLLSRWYIFEETILSVWTVVLYISFLRSDIDKEWYSILFCHHKLLFDLSPFSHFSWLLLWASVIRTKQVSHNSIFYIFPSSLLYFFVGFLQPGNCNHILHMWHIRWKDFLGIILLAALVFCLIFLLLLLLFHR